LLDSVDDADAVEAGPTPLPDLRVCFTAVEALFEEGQAFVEFGIGKPGRVAGEVVGFR